MRLWSIHPKYLDAKGLVALWREALLAKHVLESRTKGYKHHPQLIRFRQCPEPLGAINQYLTEVYNEAVIRGYKFNSDKIDRDLAASMLTVTTGQMEYERGHLLNKLQIRDPEKYKKLRDTRVFEPHPMFSVSNGGIENWEIT